MFVNSIRHFSVVTLLSVPWHQHGVFILNHSHLERKNEERITEEHTALRTVWKALIILSLYPLNGVSSRTFFSHLQTRLSSSGIFLLSRIDSACEGGVHLPSEVSPLLGAPRRAILIVRAKTQRTLEPARRIRAFSKVTVDANVQVIREL